MAITGMKKLSAIAGRNTVNKVITRLIWLRCAEIVTSDVSDDGHFVRADRSREMEIAQARVNSIDSAIGILRPYEENKRTLFSFRPEKTQNEFEGGKDLMFAAEQTSKEVISVNDDINFCNAEINRNRLRSVSLAPWNGFDLPLSYRGTSSSKVFLGTFPKTSGFDEITTKIYENSFSAYLEKQAEDDSYIYCSVIVHDKDVSETLRYLGSIGFSRVDFGDEAGKASDELRVIEGNIEKLNHRIEEDTKKLELYAKDIDGLRFAYDIASTEYTKESSENKTSQSRYTKLITAWIPENKVEDVKKTLEGLGCAYEFNDPEESDDVPVLLKNNKWATPFEYVMKMYSLPKYGSFDPTFIMSIFYFVIFGMMLADVVYGLLLMVGGFILWKKTDMSKGVKSLAQLFCYCGISCVIFGILFGGYFGDFPQKLMENVFGVTAPTQTAAWFDVTANPVNFLVISFVAGGVHLLTGMGIQAYVLIKEKHPWLALFDVGSWYILFAGIGLIFLDPVIGFIVAGVGALMLILTQGRDSPSVPGKIIGGLKSIYNIVNYVSDLLSYSRIMALGLASAIIASVVNILATMPASAGAGNVIMTIVGWIFMTLIMIIGHTINLVINLLGTYVHTSRLQYIEFFGKFFEDGGREFEPVLPEEKYTIVNNETLISEENIK